MAVLVAVLYAFSHLAADNEITAMRASGVSVYQVLTPVLFWACHVHPQLRIRGSGTPPEQRAAPDPADRYRPEEAHVRVAEQVINEVPPSQYSYGPAG